MMAIHSVEHRPPGDFALIRGSLWKSPGGHILTFVQED